MASREERKRARAKQTQVPDSKPDQTREFPENYWRETPLGTQKKDVETITGQTMSITPESQFLPSRRSINRRTDKSVR